MEIIGMFKVRTISKGENIIKAPPRSWGNYILEVNPDGSFTYRPAEGQVIPSSKSFKVWDDLGATPPVYFREEKDAIKYKEKMERNSGRSLRMEKIFPSGKNNRRILE